MSTLSEEPRIRPIAGKGVGALVLSVLLALGTSYWLIHCLRILSAGLTTLGIDTYGATWGILVANTVHIIGISHVGIAVSAAVRILRLDRYRNLARLAEVVTIVALVMAFVNLLLHVGRPDRFVVFVILHGRWHSAMVWSMTVFFLYFMASSVYLYLSMRRDLWVMSTIAPRLRGVYRLLALGYGDSPDERTRHGQALFWLALALIPIMISVHSVYGLLFGMLSARAGWYNPLQAPYFVLGAIVSGFSAITAIAALLRWAFSWQALLTDRIFRAFGILLAFVVFLYLYFMLSEHLTAQYLPVSADKAISDSLLVGRFSILFWITTVIGLVIPFIYLLVQGLMTTDIRVGLTAAAAVLINAALWIKRFLLVIPSQYHASLGGPRPPVDYVPTHTEWTVTLGSYAPAALLFVLLLRFLPMFELPVPASMPADRRPNHARLARREQATRSVVVISTLVAGLMMISWGVATRDQDYAPIKWLVGLTCLVALPLEHCLVGGMRSRPSRRTPTFSEPDGDAPTEESEHA